MVQVKTYHLPPTSLIPNSPRPVLHYPDFFPAKLTSNRIVATQAYDLFSKNGWQTQWIFRYGSTQVSHYHSEVHECMVVLSGSATIRFGIADQETDTDRNQQSKDNDGGHNSTGISPAGIEIPARAGDVFILPAGVAHKTFDPSPCLPFALLTPGDGHNVSADDQRQAIADTEISGFTMMGAYPKEGDGRAWDFCTGGAHAGKYEEIWAVAKPERDPVFGLVEDGLVGRWV